MRKKTGFTLVELLISISIIAILTVIASINFSKAQKTGRDSRRQNDMKTIQNAAEQYYLLNNSSYPSNISMPWTGPGGQNILQTFPVDPKTNVAYSPVSINSTGYCFCAGMENEKGNSSGFNCNDLSKTNGIFFCVMNQQ